MKKVLFFALCTSFSSAIYAFGFTHQALKPGAIQETCYHDPCTVGKVVNFKQLDKSSKHSTIELTLLGGEKYWKSKKIRWNKNSHKVYITCSKRNPSMKVGDFVTELPFAEGTIPGVLYSSAELYFFACHNDRGNADDAITKYGYK